MPTGRDQRDQRAFEAAIKTHDQTLIANFLNREDVKELLVRGNGCCTAIPLHYACHFKSPPPLFKMILDAAVKQGMIKEMLEQQDEFGLNSIMVASQKQLPMEAFTLLLEWCLQHADIKEMMERRTVSGRNCISLASSKQLPIESFTLLLEWCLKHADIKQMLEQQNNDGRNCIMLASENQLPVESFKVLIVFFFPSNESFQQAVASKNNNNRNAFDLAETEEIKTLLQDPDCWKNCSKSLAERYLKTALSAPRTPSQTLDALKRLPPHIKSQSSVAVAIDILTAQILRGAVPPEYIFSLFSEANAPFMFPILDYSSIVAAQSFITNKTLFFTESAIKIYTDFNEHLLDEVTRGFALVRAQIDVPMNPIIECESNRESHQRMPATYDGVSFSTQGTIEEKFD